MIRIYHFLKALPPHGRTSYILLAYSLFFLTISYYLLFRDFNFHLDRAHLKGEFERNMSLKICRIALLLQLMLLSDSLAVAVASVVISHEVVVDSKKGFVCCCY